MNPWAVPVGSVGGFTQAEFQAAVQQALARQAFKAAADEATRFGLEVGVVAAGTAALAVLTWEAL